MITQNYNKMNEMIAMPIVVALIVGTALLTAVVSEVLPYVPKWWNAFKSRNRRKSNDKDIVDVIIIAQLQDRIDELEKQVNEAMKYAKKRDSDRTAKTKQIVIEYLKELQK